MSVAEHIDGGNCWCDDMRRRNNTIDERYPDRCHIVDTGETPHHGWALCVRVADHDGPCAGALQRPGDPCHFCGAPTPTDRPRPCPRCTIDLTTMALADIKGLFARTDPDLSLDPEVPR